MPVSFDRQKGRWRYFFRRSINGKPHRFTRLLPKGITQTQADKYERDQTARLFTHAAGGEPTLDLCVKLYIDHRVPQLKSGERTALELSHLADMIDGKPLSDVGELSLKYARDNSHLAPATIRNRLAWLRAAIRYAHKKHGIGEFDYTSRMSFPSVDNERHVYLDFKTGLPAILLACESNELRALVMIAAYSGMRWQSEILKLDKSSLRDDLFILGTTKNGKPHVVPIHPKLKKWLRYIPFKTGGHRLWEGWRRAADAAGFPGLRLHDLRHSFASTLLERGATLAEVGEMLNHSSPMATKRYAHLVVNAKRKVMGRL